MKVIVLSGPSSSGKTTIIDALCESVSVSRYKRMYVYKSEIRDIAKGMGHSLDEIMGDERLNTILQEEFTERMLSNIDKAEAEGYECFITDRGPADGIVYYFLHKYKLHSFGRLLLDRLVLIKRIDHIIIVPPFTNSPLKYDGSLEKADIWLNNQDRQVEALYSTSMFLRNIRRVHITNDGYDTIITQLKTKDIKDRVDEVSSIIYQSQADVNSSIDKEHAE